jgi:AcrR family transcriptional regulator
VAETAVSTPAEVQVSALPRAIQQRQPGAQQRILKSAAELCTTDGIRAVGVDRLISRASVTKATFYKHCGSKDRVVCEYLSAVAQEHYTTLERIMAEAATARAVITLPRGPAERVSGAYCSSTPQSNSPTRRIRFASLSPVSIQR